MLEKTFPDEFFICLHKSNSSKNKKKFSSKILADLNLSRSINNEHPTTQSTFNKSGFFFGSKSIVFLLLKYPHGAHSSLFSYWEPMIEKSDLLSIYFSMFLK